MPVENLCLFETYSARCFLEMNNGVSGNNRIRKFVPVAYDSIAEKNICNVKLKMRGLKFKMVTFDGNSGGRGFEMYYFICVYINDTMTYSVNHVLQVTSLPSTLQENFGFKSCEVSQQADHEAPDDLAPRPSRHWFINDLVLFIDNEDMPRIPRELFDEVCDITVAGSPGPVYMGLIDAFKEFVRTVFFLVLVFIVVLSFGSVYKVSNTNQTLATLSGGFLPFVLRTFMAPKQPDIELGTVSFRSKLEEIISSFYQKWAMFDFPFEIGSPEDDEKKADEARPQELGERAKSMNALDNIRNPLQINSLPYMDDVDSVLRMMPGTPKKSSEKINALDNNNKRTAKPQPKNPEPDVDILIHLPEYSSEGWLQEWTDISEYKEPDVDSIDQESDGGDFLGKEVEERYVGLYKSDIV